MVQNFWSPYIILIIGSSESGKTNTLLNLTSHQPDNYETYLYDKDPYEAKCHLLINKHEDLDLSIIIILELLLNNQMIWMIFMKILINTV